MPKFITLFIPILTLVFTGCFNENNQQTTFYGNVDLRTVSLGFRVSGKVEKLYFDEGQKVKKGDLIAQLDDSLYVQELNNILAQINMQKAQVQKLENGYRKEEVSKAQASFEQSAVTLKKRTKDLKRYEKLLETNSVSKQNFDDIKLIFDNAQAQYDYAKSNLDQMKNGYLKEDIQTAKAQLTALIAQKEEAKIHLKDTKLYAPNDGVILTRAYETGSIIAQGAPIVEMAIEEDYWIRSYIDEKYLGHIQPNMRANVFTDSRPQKAYTAVVSFISPQAEFTPKAFKHKS